VRWAKVDGTRFGQEGLVRLRDGGYLRIAFIIMDGLEDPPTFSFYGEVLGSGPLDDTLAAFPLLPTGQVREVGEGECDLLHSLSAWTARGREGQFVSDRTR
jgi:hypothetical protein